MPSLHDVMADRIPEMRKEIQELVAEYGEQVISEVTVKQAYGGMRGVKGLVCDTSFVDPEQGLFIRGIPIADLETRLPEEIFFLLVTGQLPDKKSLALLQADLKERGEVPGYVFDVLKAMPHSAHPMDMLVTAIAVLEETSVFARRYEEGMRKEEYWEAALEDSLNLLARLPAVAAAVYRIRYDKGGQIESDPGLDWAGDFSHMLGNDDPDFADMMRMYLVLHSDHEGGNVSAFTSHVVASSLADAYYAVAAGLSGLAGPLHGLANQECLRWILDCQKHFGGVPTAEQMREYAWDTLNSGQVVPGYGHAVLRATDPRFIALHRFGLERCYDSPVFKTVDLAYQVIPQVLSEHGKAKNPWPNVDAGSGCLLYHFGFTEMRYYTVLFSVSRAMGILAQMIMSRAMGEPITRPKSVTTTWMKKCMQATEVKMTAGD